MKLLIIACIVSCVVASYTEEEARGMFLKYVVQFNKTYGFEEFGPRFQNFQETLARIESRGDTSTFGLTKFSDMSAAEFKAKYLGYVPRKKKSNVPVKESVGSPTSAIIDWRLKGAVTPVKNQEQCGSCWAFSATQEIESMNILKTGNTVILSPQQIVSCDTTDAGCNGGDTTTAFDYVKNAGGIEPASDYPYTSGGGDTGTCKANPSDFAVKVSGYTYATPPCSGGRCKSQNITRLNNNLAAIGPVSICVDASSWQDYTSGVLKSHCSSSWNNLDHCVQLVGSNFGAADPYWIIRNSWATDWGVDGYIYVSTADNLCGVADEATFAEIA
jgi:C1A family cysteine protease